MTGPEVATMDEAPSSSTIAPFALSFEVGLGVAAMSIGWLLNFDPLKTIDMSANQLPANLTAMLWGGCAAIPMFGALVLLQRSTIRRLRRLNRLVRQKLIPLFARATVAELALISIAAGFGEEVLFRGLVQAGLAEYVGPPWGPWYSLAIASVLFGICHWLTGTYAVLATLTGVYLGGLFLWSENLLAPMATHALYDFAALVYLVKWKNPRPES